MWKLTCFYFSREQILGYEDTDGGIVSIIRRLMRMKHLIRLVLTAAVVMSIIGGVCVLSYTPRRILAYLFTLPYHDQTGRCL